VKDCGALLACGLVLGNTFAFFCHVFGLAPLLGLLAAAAGTRIIAFDDADHALELEDLFLALNPTRERHLPELLLAFDRDLADNARPAGCVLCGGVLHSAKYPRKSRPRMHALGPEHDWRFSFCCAVDGRGTPPSLRFVGRDVYLASILRASG
jgi:hypothetical protein